MSERNDKLVIGVASSALFDLAESHKVFLEKGVEQYRTHQEQHRYDAFLPGVAFPFIKRLLSLNAIPHDGSPLVEVVIMSRNSPVTGERVVLSIEKFGLDIKRAFFTEGQSPFRYLRPPELSLFLSANKDDVDEAMRQNVPAGMVVPGSFNDDDDPALRVAFDFDGVLGSDESEVVYRTEGLDSFQQNEVTKRDTPLEVGPLGPLLNSLNVIQNIESQMRQNNPSYEPRLRIAMVTARGLVAMPRAIRTLTSHGLEVNDAFALSGSPKAQILSELRPHIFFDDQLHHLEKSPTPGVHVPYGVANAPVALPTEAQVTSPISSSSTQLVPSMEQPKAPTSGAAAHVFPPVAGSQPVQFITEIDRTAGAGSHTEIDPL